MRVVRPVSDALWPGTDDCSEPDSLCPAHAEDALSKTTSGADDRYVMRK
jgi:hypothetical protein